MARVTVEDCLEQVNNRFELVLIAAQRPRQIIKGSPTLLDVGKNNKEAVIALREIAAGLVDYDIQEAPTEEELAEAIEGLSKDTQEMDDVDIPANLFASLKALSSASGLDEPSPVAPVPAKPAEPAPAEPAEPAPARPAEPAPAEPAEPDAEATNTEPQTGAADGEDQ